MTYLEAKHLAEITKLKEELMFGSMYTIKGHVVLAKKPEDNLIYMDGHGLVTIDKFYHFTEGLKDIELTVIKHREDFGLALGIKIRHSSYTVRTQENLVISLEDFKKLVTHLSKFRTGIKRKKLHHRVLYGFDNKVIPYADNTGNKYSGYRPSSNGKYMDFWLQGNLNYET